MQVKSTVRYHPTPVRMASVKREKRKSVGENVEKREPRGLALKRVCEEIVFYLGVALTTFSLLAKSGKSDYAGFL